MTLAGNLKVTDSKLEHKLGGDFGSKLEGDPGSKLEVTLAVNLKVPCSWSGGYILSEILNSLCIQVSSSDRYR